MGVAAVFGGHPFGVGVGQLVLVGTPFAVAVMQLVSSAAAVSAGPPPSREDRVGEGGHHRGQRRGAAGARRGRHQR